MNYTAIMHACLFINLMLPSRGNSMEHKQSSDISSTIVLHHIKAEEVHKLLSSYAQFLSVNLTVVGEDTLVVSGTSTQHSVLEQITALILKFIDVHAAAQGNQSNNFLDIAFIPPF
jgi:hypothetical protein